MANIKLKNNYWVTESIYDTTDSKTQKQVNADLHQDISDLSGAINDVIEVSTNNTQSSDNKLWIDESADSQIQVPTWAEFQALSTEVDNIVGLGETGQIVKGANLPSETVLDQHSCYKVGNHVVVCARVHSMDFTATNGNSETIFRIPQGFWPSYITRVIAYVHRKTQNVFIPTICTISANDGYVNFALGTYNYDEIAFAGSYPIKET